MNAQTHLLRSDDFLASQIANLQRDILKWARSRDLWIDCGFHTDLHYRKTEPSEQPVITFLYFGGDLSRVFYDDPLGYEPAFSALFVDLR